MTMFLDVRAQAVGGSLAKLVNVAQATSLADYATVPLTTLQAAIQGRHVLMVAHGFNVDRANGIASLSNWEGLLRLPEPAVFLGLLWPGDSVWAHGLDYPEEPRIADDAGALLAPFIDGNFQGAASVSFASHSLGARVVLATIEKMEMPVRRLNLMAGAIDDNCLTTEFQAAAQNVGAISVLASKKDKVLSELFPIGNFFAGIIAEGHPWWRAAIGHRGPVRKRPANFEPPFEIPDGWDFGHGSYLEIDPQPVPVLPLPVNVPPQGTPPPADGQRGFPEAFTSAFESTRFAK